MGKLFGTDGVRGIANSELTCERAMQIGRAAASVLSEGRTQPLTVLMGMDTRISSEMLAGALSAGLCSAGVDVIDLGVIPTPAVAYLISKYQAHAGIMISASHNPYEYNGIKIFNADGYKLEDALEGRIESIILDGKPGPRLAASGKIGRVIRTDRAATDYIDRLCSTVSLPLDGMRIAVDCANGAASRTAAALFGRLGAECTVLHASPDGRNINDSCGSTHPDALREYVTANGLDAGAAFDGDADRCLMIDDRGEVVDGDMIMAMLALDMKARGRLNRDTVVGTIMTNFGFSKFCKDNGIGFVAARVGDRYVLEEMLRQDYSLGGEQSGHIILRDFAATGDGQLTAVQVLALLRRTGMKLSDAAKAMTRCPQFTVNIPASAEAKAAFETDHTIRRILEDARAAIGNGGRLIARPSGTEPLIRIMAEGEDPEAIRAAAKDTAARIPKQLESYR